MISKKEKRKVITEIITEKEPDANKVIAYILIMMAGIFFIVWGVMQTSLYISSPILNNIALLGNGFIYLMIVSVCLILKGKPRWIKYAMMTILVISVLEINLMTGFKVLLLFALPLVISCRYYNYYLTSLLGVINSLVMIVGAYCNAFVIPKFGLIDLNTVSYDKETVIYITHSLYDAVLMSNLNSETVLSNTLILSTIPCIVINIVITVGCVAAINYGQSVIYEANLRAQHESKMKIELEMKKQRIMMSQIQPHFLYNSLSAIMAIDGNPDETIEAIGEFGKYLRENLDSLTSDELIPFEKEMLHVKRYVSLEKIRFNDNLKVEYDIKTADFDIPIMTIQMLAENAIKHGITIKENGGKLTIKTFEDEKNYNIVVEDDGVGFDPTKIPKEENHIGLNNSKSRIINLCNGTFNIDSKIGKGTKIGITIPKGDN